MKKPNSIQKILCLINVSRAMHNMEWPSSEEPVKLRKLGNFSEITQDSSQIGNLSEIDQSGMYVKMQYLRRNNNYNANNDDKYVQYYGI